MWEFEKRHGTLPSSPADVEETQEIGRDIWSKLDINPRGVKALDPAIIE